MKILASLGLVSVGLITGIWYAWILACMWGWFVVPWMHLSPLGIGYAYGLMLIVGLMAHSVAPPNEKDPNQEQLFVALLGRCLTGALMLGIAYITHLIVG